MSQDQTIIRRFGKRVRALRENRGWSQEAFAAEMGMHRTYVSDVERGLRNVSLRNVVRIATTLNVTISSLFEDIEN